MKITDLIVLRKAHEAFYASTRGMKTSVFDCTDPVKKAEATKVIKDLVALELKLLQKYGISSEPHREAVLDLLKVLRKSPLVGACQLLRIKSIYL